MTSGFTGGGPADFFGGGGGGGLYRFQNLNNIINNNNNNNLPQQQQQQQQFGGFGIDVSGQIGHRRLDLVGKRSLADFQSYPQIHHLLQSQNHQASTIPMFQQQQPLNLLPRSVKPRMVNYHNNLSPISTLSPPVDLSPPLPAAGTLISHLETQPSSSPMSPATRYGVPVYQHLRPNPISLINNNNNFLTTTTTTQLGSSNPLLNYASSGLGFSNLGPNRVPLTGDAKPVPGADDSKVLITLQELENQLLCDDDEGDALSVVTNSEWSAEIQNLMASATAQPTAPVPVPPPTALISPSPTSSSSSCSSSTSPPPAKQLILEAAAAIDDGKKEAAAGILSRLSQVACVTGNFEQRLAAYMAHALRSRAFPGEIPPPVKELCCREHAGFLYMLYDHSPCFKYGLLAANYVILETIASEKGKMVHVVDFDAGDGGQYLNLVRAVGDRQSQVGGDGRPGGVPIPLRVTSVTTDLSSNCGGSGATEARDRVLNLAEQAGVKLRFDVVARPVHELTRESLGCGEEEVVVVNFAFKLHRVPDESVSMENFRDELLRRAKGLRPRVVTLVEQEMNLNTAPFLTRVSEASGYYGAVFESMETTKARDDPDRLRMEEALGRSMANAVACEGRERLERCEVFGKWRARMGMAGFELRPLGRDVVESMQGKLGSAPGGNGGLTVNEEGGGGVAFGWNGRNLVVASAWR